MGVMIAMEKIHSRICEVCGEQFFSSITYGRCCSDKCRTRRWRKTDKGRACAIRGNKKHKRSDINKACIHCKEEYVTAQPKQKLCSKCSGEHGAYYAQLKHRLLYPEKGRIRDRTNKRKDERHTSKKNLPCEVCGEEKTEAHHYNYNHPLNINWLCKKHHIELHNRIKVYEKEWHVDFKHKKLGKYFKKLQLQILQRLAV